MDLGNPIDCSALPPNWRDDLSWRSGWVAHGECTYICNALVYVMLIR